MSYPEDMKMKNAVEQKLDLQLRQRDQVFCFRPQDIVNHSIRGTFISYIEMEELDLYQQVEK